MTPPAPKHVRIAIVGTGFSGIGAAIRLQQEGYTDFALFERADRIGGVWRDNTYPGAACDVESHLYSFSFAPNPNWTRTFSPQQEILAYLKDCAERFDILRYVHFNHELQEACWDDDAQLWRLETSQGVYTANFLIGGMGHLAEPQLPKVPGLDRFQGEQFHSARWNHDFDLTGKRVAVVGTGASAIQFVPEIQPKVASLKLVQRTPAWVIPRMDRGISRAERFVLEKLPAARKLVRTTIYARREAFVVGFRNPMVMRMLEGAAKRYMRQCISDPALREKLTPNFRLGCKRILISKDYLPALAQPNVEVITHGLSEVREHSIVTADGVEHEVDAIIFGTGFHVTDMPFARRIRGRDGETLHTYWKGSPKAFLGTSVPGFPNLFMLLGPNTGLGHSSVILMAEAQIQLVLETLKHMDANRLGTVEPKLTELTQFAQTLDNSLSKTVWNSGGCSSWYLDETGRNSTLWPTTTFSFMRQAHFHPQSYLLAPARTSGELAVSTIRPKSDNAAQTASDRPRGRRRKSAV